MAIFGGSSAVPTRERRRRKEPSNGLRKEFQLFQRKIDKSRSFGKLESGSERTRGKDGRASPRPRSMSQKFLSAPEKKVGDKKNNLAEKRIRRLFLQTCRRWGSKLNFLQVMAN